MNSDANSLLRQLDMNWHSWRGVVFLDPFATQVEWSTVKAISGIRALDMRMLFPTSAVARLIPLCRKPDDLNPKWANRLTRFFGGECWRSLYAPLPQRNLFVEEEQCRQRGVCGLLRIYREKLESAFGERFLNSSRPLKNSSGARIFELLFCVGSPNFKAIALAKRIAKHILERL